MIKIKDYITNIYNDFKKFIESENSLCELKSLNYQAGKKPDYSNKQIQQFYLLRYAFAYAFEYKVMFKYLFKREKFDKNIQVTSIGCGSYIDYWSIVEALEAENMSECKIIYNGIDIIDWNYKIKKRDQDDLYFCQCNILDVLKSVSTINSNVYIFPKSISEFSRETFEEICNCFKTKYITKDKFHVLISLRSDSGSMDRDMERSQMLIDAITTNGFASTDISRNYKYITKEDTGIRALDSQFEYLDDAIALLSGLDKYCVNYKKDSTKCSCFDCSNYLNRWPTLKAKNIHFQVLTFQREDLQ